MPRRLLYLPPLLLALLIYLPALSVGYLYDDTLAPLTDYRLRTPSLWHEYFTRDYYYIPDAGEGSIENLYRPLTSLSFALQAWWHQTPDRARLPLHLANLLLFAACTAAITRLAELIAQAPQRGTGVSPRGMGVSPRGMGVSPMAVPTGPLSPPQRQWLSPTIFPLLTGLLFAAHPVHAEAVTTIVGRSELLVALFTLLALILHLSRPPSLRNTLAITACLLAALLSKEQGLLTPLILLASEPLRRRLHPPTSQQPSPSLQLLILSSCLLTASYIVLREYVLHLKFWWDPYFLDKAIQPLARPDADRLLMPLVLLGRYTHLLLFPTHLSFDYSGAAIGYKVSPADPYLYIGIATTIALLGALVALILSLRRRHPLAPVHLLLLTGFLLTYGLVSNAPKLIGVNLAERLMFLPSAFVCLAAGLFFSHLLTSPTRQRWLIPSLSALITLASLHTVLYVSRWTHPLSFFEWTLRTNPNAMRIHQILMAEYAKRGRLDEAARLAAHARQALPDYYQIYLESALISEQQGRLTEAEQFLKQAQRLNPDLAWMHIAAFHSRHPLPATQPGTRPTTQP